MNKISISTKAFLQKGSDFEEYYKICILDYYNFNGCVWGMGKGERVGPK